MLDAIGLLQIEPLMRGRHAASRGRARNGLGEGLPSDDPKSLKHNATIVDGLGSLSCAQMRATFRRVSHSGSGEVQDDGK